MPINIDENTVLYFEDDHRHRKRYGDALRDESYIVKEYASAETCLRETDEESTPGLNSPAAALIDLYDENYHTPKEAGLDIIRQLRGRWPHMHIITLSAFSEYEWIKAAGEAYGAAGEYIVKDSDDDINFIKARLRVHIDHYVSLGSQLEPGNNQDDVIRNGKLHTNASVNPMTHTLKDQPLSLGRTAAQVLGLLALQPNREISYEKLREFAGIAKMESDEAERHIENRVDDNEAAIADYQNRHNLTDKENADMKKRLEARPRIARYVTYPGKYIEETAQAAVRQQITNIRKALVNIDERYRGQGSPISSIPSVGYLLDTRQL